ncbi:Uncharacterised protein [Chlamydia abortus]|nr:Uncharacterised protein [Chlamydia abortus]
MNPNRSFNGLDIKLILVVAPINENLFNFILIIRLSPSTPIAISTTPSSKAEYKSSSMFLFMP